MSFNFSPKIVTNGLILYLDAANTKSYVSGGTTWNDLSNNQNNGTLFSGVTFNSNNGGTLSFDGVNDYYKTNNIVIPSTGAFSVGFIYSLKNNFGRGGVFDRCTTNSTKNGFSFGQGGASTGVSGWYCSVITNSATSITTSFLIYPTLNVTYFDYVVFNGTNILSAYRNGVLINSTTGSTQGNLDTDGQREFLIANRDNGNYISMDINNIQIYNRELSPQEVIQNFNALRNRFRL